MSLRYAGIRAPGPGSLVDHQHPLGYGCVGSWWPNAAVDAGSGLSIPDLSPAAMHATLTAGTSWGLGYDGLSWGYKATTTSHYGTVPYSPAQDVQTGLFSVMAIVQPSESGEYCYFTKTIAAGNYYTWALGQRRDDLYADPEDDQWSNAFYFSLYNGSVNATASASGLTVGVTYLLVGVRDVSKCYLWVQNLSTGVITRGSDILFSMSASTKPIYIGRCAASSPGVFQGVGSGYAVWNRALSEQDVITLCNEPAAMIWEPGRKSISYPSAGATPITVTHAVGLYAAESYAATRGLGLSGAEQATLERSMALVAQEVADLSRTLGLSGADTESLTRTMTLRGLEALAATAGTSLQAAEVASATQAVATYAQEVGTLARSLGLSGAEQATLERSMALVAQEVADLSRTLGLSGADTESLTRTMTLRGLEALEATRTSSLRAQEVTAALHAVQTYARQVQDLSRSMQLVGREVETLARSLGLSAAETDSLTRAMTLRGLEALAATAGTSLQAAEVASATQAVATYAQEVGTLARSLAAYAQEVGTLTREAGATGADPLALTRALGLYATIGEDLFGTWLAQTFGAETSSLTRGITLWAKEVAVGVRDVLRIADERGTLRLKDLRDDLRLQDGRDTLQLE